MLLLSLIKLRCLLSRWISLIAASWKLITGFSIQKLRSFVNRRVSKLCLSNLASRITHLHHVTGWLLLHLRLLIVSLRQLPKIHISRSILRLNSRLLPSLYSLNNRWFSLIILSPISLWRNICFFLLEHIIAIRIPIGLLKRCRVSLLWYVTAYFCH